MPATRRDGAARGRGARRAGGLGGVFPRHRRAAIRARQAGANRHTHPHTHTHTHTHASSLPLGGGGGGGACRRIGQVRAPGGLAARVYERALACLACLAFAGRAYACACGHRDIIWGLLVHRERLLNKWPDGCVCTLVVWEGRLISGRASGRDVGTGERRRGVLSLCVVGSRLACGSADGSIKVWAMGQGPE